MRVLVAVLLVGCSRGPGPSESEFGDVFFWQIAEHTEPAWGDCTDDPEFRAVSSSYDDIDGTYLFYQVAQDGSTASDMDCTTTSTDSCTEGDPPLVMTVDGSHLSGEGRLADEPLAGADCHLLSTLVQSLEDRGEQLAFSFVTRYDLEGPDCASVASAFVASSGNGFGVDGCTLRVEGTADFRKSEPL